MDQTKETKRLEPHRRLLFKPIENSETGGCHIDVFLPKTTSGAPIGQCGYHAEPVYDLPNTDGTG